MTSWASTGCRPWGARRTRSTPTSWRATSLRRDTAAPRMPEAADLVVVNTCAFIDAARQESIDTVLTLADQRRPGARLVVTGCMAERYGDELRDALPEVDLVAGFGADLTEPLGVRPARSRPGHARRPVVVPRPDTGADDQRLRPARAAAARGPRPVGLRQGGRGCDRICGFCAIPSFRGKQRSRSVEDVLAEVDALACDRPTARRRCARSSSSPRTSPPTAATARARAGAPASPTARRPSPRSPAPCRPGSSAPGCSTSTPPGLTDELIETVLATGVPYFDLSLQHVARPLLARMRRWGDGDRFLRRIADIRARRPRRHLPFLVHPRLPGRDRARPRPPARVPRARRSSTGPASSPSPARTAPTPPDSTTRCRPSSLSSACASAPSCRTPSRRPSGTR